MADPSTGPERTMTSDAVRAESGPKQLPKGLVLGKDGKPCRSCNSFAAWAAQAKGGKAGRDRGGMDGGGGGSSSSSSNSSMSGSTIVSGLLAPDDCPPDRDVLGRSGWTMLHSVAAAYPEKASPTEQGELRAFVGLFAKLYPCGMCARDFQAYLKNGPPPVDGRRPFGLWLCEAHNEVNRKLGKPVFDCSRWEERWRTGPPDGRCD